MSVPTEHDEWAALTPARREQLARLLPIEARELLAGIDRETLLGRRDHCLLLLMLRTGLRRSEGSRYMLRISMTGARRRWRMWCRITIRF